MIGFAHAPLLWALTGLSIPIAIHLLSRKEEKIIYVGSLRHLTTSFTRQFRSVRLNQLLLLFLRMMLILILVLILGGLYWNSAGRLKKWLVFENGTEKYPELRQLKDSLEIIGYESRALAAGFPPIDDSTSGEKNNYWLLAQELGALPLTDVIIFSQMNINNFRGRKLAQPSNQRWVALDPKPTTYPANAIAFKKDSLSVRIGSTNSQKTEFKTVRIRKNPTTAYFKTDGASDSVLITKPKQISVRIVCDDSLQNVRRIFVAALTTIQQAFHIKIGFNESNQKESSPRTDFVIWLSRATPRITDSSTWIVLHETGLSSSLLLQEKNVWLLTRCPGVDDALSENLTSSLAEILLDSPGQRGGNSTHDERVIPPDMAWDRSSIIDQALPAKVNVRISAEIFLFALFVIVLLIERSIAWSRSQ